MKDERRPARSAAVNSSADDGSSGRGRRATWAAVDATLKIRDRIACCIDALDVGDVDLVSVNLAALLYDLDDGLAA